MDKMSYELVPIDMIEPNPLNPRKNLAQETEQIQKVIEQRGWETGITCYLSDEGKCRILSGHRRWYAAKELGEEEIPVFLVQPPKSELEELERLASAQGGKVDWTPYEWARYTFDLWNLRGGTQGKTTHKELAMKLGVSERAVYKRLQVFRYYDHRTIEQQLMDGTLTISILSESAHWIDKLKLKHPDIVDELSLDFIKKAMITKAENKCFSSKNLRVDKFLEVADKKIIKEFLRDSKMPLKEAYKKATGEEMVGLNSGGSKFRQTISVLEKRQEEITAIDAAIYGDAEKLFAMLEELESKLKNKIEEVAEVIER